MKKFRKKQKTLNRIMRVVLIFAVIFLFVYIGAEPYIAEASELWATYINGFCDVLVIAAMVLLFIYYDRYSKSDIYLENIEYEISDFGFYYSNREEENAESLVDGIMQDLRQDRYAINSKIQLAGFDFEFYAHTKKEFFFCAYVEDLGKDDVITYLDIAVNHITSANIKRGSIVMLLITNNVSEGAASLSKVTASLGRRNQLQANVALLETGSKKCFFLGNKASKCQQMILSYVMLCKSPIDKELRGDEKIEFQKELEEHMETFTIKDYKNGKFSAHEL